MSEQSKKDYHDITYYGAEVAAAIAEFGTIKKWLFLSLSTKMLSRTMYLHNTSFKPTFSEKRDNDM